MEPANTHAIVRRMAAAGLIETRRDPANRRVVLAALTASGMAIAASLDEYIEVATAQTLAALRADERVALVEMLARIVVADGAIKD